jgi:prepilin-type N-terminal cleavage/methylation domain-containing protein
MQKGFTLIELLIGLTLFAVIMGVGNVLLVTSLQGARKASATGVTKAEGAYAMNSMVSMTRYARSINCPTTVPAGRSLDVTRLNGDVITYRFDTAPAVDTIASESGTLPLIRRVELTSPRVNVTSTGCASGRVFTCPDSSTVVICFNVVAVNSLDFTDSETVNFNSRVTLRNIGN